MPSPETPAESFKRALAHAARALAEKAELEVAFSGERPGVRDGIAYLPQPPRDLESPEAQGLRGQADQLALRVAHHDEAVFSKTRPADPAAQRAFEAAETARIDALGARALGGVRANLATALDQRLSRLLTAPSVKLLPIDEVLALVVRERLTGDAAPAVAQASVEALRGEIEKKAGRTLDRLDAAIEDQTAFAQVVRQVLRDLEIDPSADAATVDCDTTATCGADGQTFRGFITEGLPQE